MRIFVTGATGVIGRRLVPLLVGDGHEVTAVGRTLKSRAALERAGARPVDVSLFDADGLRRAVAGHQAVVNLATHMPEGLGMFLPGAWRENDRLRSVGSANLVAAALAGGAARFIQESFAPVYPDSGDRWIDESTPIQPSHYNQSVANAEGAAKSFTDAGGIGIVLRFTAFYGPDSSQVRALISSIRRGWVPVPGYPWSFTSSVSHDDAATAVVAALGGKAGVYNVVDDEPMRRRLFYDLLADALEVRRPKFPPSWASHLLGSVGEMLARSLRISNRKLREECGWAPRYPSVRQGWPAVVEELAK